MTVKQKTFTVALDANNNPQPLTLIGVAVGFTTTRWVVINNLTPYVMQLEGISDNGVNEAAVPPGTANKYQWTSKSGPLVANWVNPITGAPPTTPTVTVEYSDDPTGKELAGTYPAAITGSTNIGNISGSVTISGPTTIGQALTTTTVGGGTQSGLATITAGSSTLLNGAPPAGKCYAVHTIMSANSSNVEFMVFVDNSNASIIGWITPGNGLLYLGGQVCFGAIKVQNQGTITTEVVVAYDTITIPVFP